MQFCLPVTVKSVLSYAPLFVLTPPAHVRGRKGPAGRGVAAVGAWRREARRRQTHPAGSGERPQTRGKAPGICAEREGRCTRLGQERDRRPEAKLLVSVLRGKADARGWVRRETTDQRQSSWCLCWAGTGIVCQTTPKWAQRNKHVFWNDYMFTLRSSVTLGASFWKWVSLSRAGVSKEPGCPHRAGAQPVWPQWAAPPAELESEPKPPSRGTSPDCQLPHFTPGFSANL